jgi:hypothetical protein
LADKIIATEAFAGKLCSICQTKIIIGEEVTNCFACQLPFHLECWDENKGCSAYGCTGAPFVEKKELYDDSKSWITEKKCPNCSKTIKGKALKCHFCKTVFDSADEISRDQFSQREYNEDEFLQARNKIIGLFIISMTGFLSILGLIFSLILIYAGSLWGIEYKRMPAVLKIFSHICLWLSSFLILVLILILIFD